MSIENLNKFLDFESKNKTNMKPHKYALLLAVVLLYKKNYNIENKFVLNHELISFYLKCYNLLYGKEALENSIEAPFYYLTSSGFWNLKIRLGKEYIHEDIIKNKKSRFTVSRINEIFEYAYLSEAVDTLFRDEHSRTVIARKIVEEWQKLGQMSSVIDNDNNFFLDYLSSLQRLSGSNENALAEFQACSAYFSYISVPHPLLKDVVEEMKQGDAHIILTGHAGDGKTTLAFAAYKALRDMPDNEPFTSYLPIEKPFAVQGQKMVLVKDLSEHELVYRPELLRKFVQNDVKALLVSNTGALLDFFISQAEIYGVNRLTVEGALLECLESHNAQEFTFGSAKFKIYNLALWDNILSAKNIFKRILHDENWEKCTSCEHSSRCPVHINRTVLKEDSVLQRVIDIYTRIRAYGTRLTLRQLTEHFSYCLTGGLQQADLCSGRKEMPAYMQYAFFNLFFGDRGTSSHLEAENMAAIKAISSQKIGQKPFTHVNKKLWYIQQIESEVFGIPQVLRSYFDKLNGLGCRHSKPNAGASVRLQLRRMLYFCHDAPLSIALRRSIREDFLNSPATVLYDRISSLSSFELRDIEDKLFHVLLEHCTGIVLPQDAVRGIKEKYLYLTLNRLQTCSRKSVQILYGSLPWKYNFRLETYPQSGEPVELRLVGCDRAKGIHIILDIPFLDYILRRNNGELGNVLQSSFLQRLDSFKASIAPRCLVSQKNETEMLRYLSDYSLTTDTYSFTYDRLEVR